MNDKKKILKHIIYVVIILAAIYILLVHRAEQQAN